MTCNATRLSASMSALALAVALTATGGSQDEWDDTLSVDFDGERCTVEGPTDLTAGQVVLEVANGTPRTVEVVLARVDRGHTVDDLVEHLSPAPSRVGPPPFVRVVDGTPAGPGRIESRALPPLPNGEYGLVCLEYVDEVPASNPTAYPAEGGQVTITGQCGAAGPDQMPDHPWRAPRAMPAPPR